MAVVVAHPRRPPLPRLHMTERRLGRYLLDRQIAMGGMAEIWLARQDGVAGFEKDIVIKRILPHMAKDQKFVEMFLDEARLAARLTHPNIVQIYAIGEHEGRPFLAMEFLDGEDLGQALKKRGPLNPADAAEAIRQAAVGLREAQRAGVVHRDVKPSNLVDTSQGAVKVTDFGLAKALQEDLSITATGVFVGTPDYLAPEQAMGDEVDSRADVYALGCSLFHMCSGHPPFRKGGHDDHYTAVVRRHLKSERPQLKLEVAGFDIGLSDLCRRMMSRRPGVRPTFDELIDKLGEYSQKMGGRIPPRHQDVELLEATRASPAELVETDDIEPESRRSKTVALAVAAGIAIGVGVSAAVIMALR